MITYYIYTLSCNETQQPFYVGVSRSMNWRFKDHTGNKYNDTYKKIKTLKQGASIDVIESIEVDKVEGRKIPLAARKIEEYWIHQLRQWGFTLVNKRINTTARTYPVNRYFFYKSLKNAA